MCKHLTNTGSVAWMRPYDVGAVLASFVFCSGSAAAGPRTPALESQIVSWEDARPLKADWGEMRTYLTGHTRGTRDVFAAIAVVKPGQAVHRAHRHAEEEYLVINEGAGTWRLADKESPAGKGDILYVEPWVYHGLVNTSDKPLVFTVIKFNGKGVQTPPQPDSAGNELKHQTVTLEDGDAPITMNIAYRASTVERHPVILMPGTLKPGELPAWSVDLVDEGYMLAAFSAAYPPDPDPARRPQWLFFDQRFAHSYVLGGARAPRDAGRVIDYLIARGDVHPDKIGWMGSSSTGIPGLAVATREPRLAAVVAFVSTGAYQQWLETWHANKLWRGKTKELWPETEELLEYDPIRHVDKMFPTAVLMVSGGDDKIVDPETARAFVEAARPHYRSDPHRLRLVIYDGFGHNLPMDVVKMYAEHWFRLYMHPTRLPPKPPKAITGLQKSAARTQINAADHKDIVGAP